jgi:hypothetical protein
MADRARSPRQGGRPVLKFLRALGTYSFLWAAAFEGTAASTVAAAESTAVATAPAVTADEDSAQSVTSKASLYEMPLAALDDEALEAITDGRFVIVSTSSEEDYWENCDADYGSLWTVRTGAVILERSRPDDDVIARPAGGLLTVSAGGDFDFDWSGGVDIYVARQPFNGIGAEFRYFNLDSNAGYDYALAGDLDIGHTSVINLFDVDARYGSKLHSSEFNVRLPSSARTTWLAGFRWIELSEELNYDIDLLSLVNNDFRWNTDNHMYGGQGGVDLQLWDLESAFSINSVLKAGVYGNNAGNHFHYRVNDISILNGNGATTDVSFVGDIGVNLSYQVTRHFSLNGGYQLLWISGAALASDQAARTIEQLDVDVLTTSGDLFYHGALTGATVTW